LRVQRYTLFLNLPNFSRFFLQFQSFFHQSLI
jgi:hypothetical protein